MKYIFPTLLILVIIIFFILGFTHKDTTPPVVSDIKVTELYSKTIDIETNQPTNIIVQYKDYTGENIISPDLDEYKTMHTVKIEHLFGPTEVTIVATNEKGITSTTTSIITK